MEIVDFRINITDKISVICKSNTLLDEYKRVLTDSEREYYKDLIPEDQLAGMKILDNFIPTEDVLGLKLIDENGLEIFIGKCLCWVGSEVEGYSLDISALDFSMSQGVIEDSDDVKMYKILECDGKEKEMHYDEVFTPTDLENLKYFGEKHPILQKSIGFFFFEDSYVNTKNIEEELTDNLYYLLSFFLGNFVSLRISILEGPRGRQINIGSINTMALREGTSIFYYERPFELAKFLNCTYDNYVNFKDLLGLKAVIRHFVRMRASNHLELTLLMGSVLMESLKYHYAKEYKRYREVNNRFIKPSSAHKPVRQINSNDKFSFRELVEELFVEFKVEHNSTSFITYRNEVIHQGVFNLQYSDAKRIINELENSIREVMFNILQYNGIYFDNETYEYQEYNPPTL